MLAWTRSSSSSLVASSLGSRLRCAAVSLESGMTRGGFEEARFSNDLTRRTQSAPHHGIVDLQLAFRCVLEATVVDVVETIAISRCMQ